MHWYFDSKSSRLEYENPIQYWVYGNPTPSWELRTCRPFSRVISGGVKAGFSFRTFFWIFLIVIFLPVRFNVVLNSSQLRDIDDSCSRVSVSVVCTKLLEICGGERVGTKDF
ncbi:uncharacterized protein LOC122267125 [Penaeus japonicus]|uniref:uncharacterized protein LOC122267125 n=1 Tax=Penaeus japonicus TaxID=27405 RepID=UPI001C70DB04|nr:uncharacterized protein LOC122267125 [Penaeus japonicus]